MISILFQLLSSFVFLIFSANIFVKGSSALASKLGVSHLIIGLTIVAIGTSAPELFVSAMAAIQGNPEIAFGNAIGSNIANIGFILGVCAAAHPLVVRQEIIKQDLPALLLISLLVSFALWQFGMNIFTGIFITIIFFAYTYFLITKAKGHKKEATQTNKKSINKNIEIDQETQELLSRPLSFKRTILYIILGLVALPISSHYLVDAASNIAISLGISELVVSLTIVAVGTSLPELASSAAGVYHRNYDLAIGNVVGSNIFNITAVLVPACFLSDSELTSLMYQRDLSTMLLLTALLFIFSLCRKLSRFSGAILLISYIAYIISLVN